MQMVINQTSNMQSAKFLSAKIGNLENYAAAASSCFIDAFPLPFQEVSGDEHGTQTLSYGNIVQQERSWQSLPHTISHPDKPLGSESSPLKCPLSRKQDIQSLPILLPPPLPLQRKSPSPECHENDSNSRQKQQPAMSSCRLGKSIMVSSGGRALPEDFTPRKWSVLVGRDKKCFESPGNKRLHVIIGWYLQRYAKSHDDKEEKSNIISEIESTVRSACEGEGGGAFVRYSNGRWWEVDPSQVREKIGRMLREALHTNYSSSSKQKRAKHRLLRRSVSLSGTP